MISQGRRHWLKMLGLLGLAACDRSPHLSPLTPLWPEVESSETTDTWVVATRLGSTIYHVDPDGNLSGLEVDLVNRFADQQGMKVKFLLLSSQEEVRWALYSKHAHFAAAGLLEDLHWKEDARFCVPYRRVTPQVVYSRAQEKSKIDSIDDLEGSSITCIADSLHQTLLEELIGKQHLDIHLDLVPARIDPIDLMARIEEGSIRCAVADSHQVQLAQQYYPSITVAFDLPPQRNLAWAFPFGREDKLFAKANQYFAKINANGDLSRLSERYFGHLGTLGEQDVRQFLENRLRVLPRFVDLFKKAQVLAGFDWRLLAALAYQESKWDPLATSPTGVRGIMMLTVETADALKVSDRLDPKQAIPAGARYLAQILDALPPSIQDQDRLWLALAAYNVGNAHLEDARILAQREGRNPSRWVDVKHALPQLSDPAIFQDLKFGYARGKEPVNFVDSVRSYYKILQHFETEYTPPLEMQFNFTPRQ